MQKQLDKMYDFRASAAIPRIYRRGFPRDIYKDLQDLDLLTIGMVNDMFVESWNDEHKYAAVLPGGF